MSKKITNIEKLHNEMKKSKFSKKRIIFTNISNIKNPIGDSYIARNKNVKNELIKNLNEINLLFSYILSVKRPDLLKYAPYKITLSNLVQKNIWTSGDYVAVEQPDGSLLLSLAFQKIFVYKEFPIYSLVWVLFHEFRHKIQLKDEKIKSVIGFPNWANFKKYIQKQTGKDEDLINHIFHELNPAEVDANIFASEMTGGQFAGNAFNITPDSLLLLQKTKKTKCSKK